MTNTKNQFDKYFVLDTNIILQDANSVVTLSDGSQNLIIIPETVLDEVDSKKSGFDEINYQAREFGRLLSTADVISMESFDEYKVISMRINHGLNVKVDIISKEEYKVETSKSTASNIINDRKILEIALIAQKHYGEDRHIEFLSMDIMARVRASSLSIPTNPLTGITTEEFDFSFHETIELEEELTPEDINGKFITDFEPDHESHNFSYSFKMPSGREILTAIHKGGVCACFDEEEVRKQVVAPRNKEQLFFSNAILDNRYQILVVDAKAGSGKTLLAVSGAMRMVRKKQYSKIIYVRNSIESLDKGEDVGYLSGNDQKFKIYNHPIMDSIEYIVRSEMKKSINNKQGAKESDINPISVEEKIEEVLSQYSIETLWSGEARGRTLSDAVVILDEAQNMSNKTMQLVLTRVDASCKVIILGSTNQIDNFYINKHTNGLTTILNSTKNAYDGVNLFSIKLSKVLRGPITEWAENLFSKEK